MYEKPVKHKFIHWIMQLPYDTKTTVNNKNDACGLGLVGGEMSTSKEVANLMNVKLYK